MLKSNNKKRLAYFVSHPIQYQAPLLKLLAEQDDIDLTVFFLCDVSTRAYEDKGFGQTIEWGVPLLEGYQYEFLESKFSAAEFSVINPKVALSSVSKVFNSQSWDAVWIHGYANIALLYVIFLCRVHRIPLFLRGESNLICTRMGKLKSIFIRSLIKQCHALLYIGSDNRDYYQHYGANQQQLFAVPYAVDNQSFQAPAKPPSNAPLTKPENKMVVLYASKFMARKHPLLLIHAFNALNDQIKENSELWFVGDGEQRQVMQQTIRKYKLEHSVKLLGFKNQTELPWYFSQCDVFVLPSEKEPFGLIINEVMNQAKAIITTEEVGAARDLVTATENGWVVKAGSQTELESALNDALSNPVRLAKMGQTSLNKINSWNYAADLKGVRSALRSLDSS